MTDRKRAKRVSVGCLFCGRRWMPGIVVKSREHVLGQWIRRLEENHPSEQRSFQAGFEFDEVTKELVEARPEIVHRKAALLTLKTRDVCEDCNQGWMSDLEEAVKPTVLQLAKSAKTGLAIALARETAREFARWAQKTALTYELTSDAPHAGNAAMGQQLRAGNPLRGSMVWVARHPRDYDLSIALARVDVSSTPVPRPGPPDRQVLLVDIVYHHVSIFVFITDSPGQAWPPLAPAQWALVWPPFGVGLVEYPPLSSVTGPELTAIFTQPGRWIPPARVPIRRSGLAPNIRHRN
jgi:hypothetical protein